MGILKLFGKKSKEEVKTEKTEVLPLTIKTSDVTQTLNQISKKHNIAVSTMDFNVLDVKTYIKPDKNSDFIIAEEDTLTRFKDEEFLLNEELEVKQSYELKVKKYELASDFELLGEVRASNGFTQAEFIINPASLLNYSQTLEINLLDDLNKKKLKSGMLIHLNDDVMLEDIQKIVTKVRVMGTVEEETIVRLCNFIKLTPSIDGEIIDHYKKEIEDAKQRVDHKQKNFIFPIKEGEKMIEMIKPQMGKNGRDCKGQLIQVSEPKTLEFPNYTFSEEEIVKEESDAHILFSAKKNGYIYFEDMKILIKDELEINEISLQTTGSIIGATDSDVKLEVKEKDALKEAIGDGMKVETTELVVRGNVGKKAELKVKKLLIEGQTHKESSVDAKEAEIYILRGYLHAESAKIHRLEGGHIEADSVHIMQAVSGRVTARDIYIEIMGSHIKLTASEKIEVDTVKGSENVFTINPTLVKHQKEAIAKLKSKNRDLKIIFDKRREEYQNSKGIILRNRESIHKIKEKMLQNKKQNIKTNPALIHKYRKFNELLEKTKDLEAEVKEIKNEINSNKEEIDKMQNAVLHARIISHSGWNEYNRIAFKILNPDTEIVYDTKIGDNNYAFRLKAIEEGFKIVKIEKEENDSRT